MIKITKEKIGLVLGAAAIVSNPLTGQYVMQGIEQGFQYMFLHGAVISLVTGLYFISLIGLYMYKNRTIDNIPSKTAKTKTQKYLEA